jgi:hypothetical protein
MKPGSIGDPDFCLGAKLKKLIVPNIVEAWTLSPSKYVQEAVLNGEQCLTKMSLPPSSLKESDRSMADRV